MPVAEFGSPKTDVNTMLLIVWPARTGTNDSFRPGPVVVSGVLLPGVMRPAWRAPFVLYQSGEEKLNDECVPSV